MCASVIDPIFFVFCVHHYKNILKLVALFIKLPIFTKIFKYINNHNKFNIVQNAESDRNLQNKYLQKISCFGAHSIREESRFVKSRRPCRHRRRTDDGLRVRSTRSDFEFFHRLGQPVVVDPPALAAPDGVRSPVRFALESQKDVLQGAVVDFVLLQEFLLLHQSRFVFQLVYHGILSATEIV